MEIDPALLQPRGRGPFQSSASGCGAYVTGATTQPRPCNATPGWAGVIYYQYPTPSLCWAFACDTHVEVLHAPRRLLDRDHAELDHRRAQHHLALAGRPYQPTRPLATGRTAKQLLARAIAWHTATATTQQHDTAEQQPPEQPHQGGPHPGSSPSTGADAERRGRPVRDTFLKDRCSGCERGPGTPRRHRRTAGEWLRS